MDQLHYDILKETYLSPEEREQAPKEWLKSWHAKCTSNTSYLRAVSAQIDSISEEGAQKRQYNILKFQEYEESLEKRV